MSVATSTTFDGTSGTATHIERTAYDYDHTGIRVSASTDTLDPADGTTVQATDRVEFLNDPQNFTGYSQVIRETHRDGSGQLTKEVTYTFGLDELSQTSVTFENGQASSPTTVTFAHDGHGSVRALLDAAGAIATLAGQPGASAIRQLFTYDAYGNALGFNMSAAVTVLLYSGEQFDQHVLMQYLRARFYDAMDGRFVGLDPYFGNSQDPQSFHKYLFTGGNPTNLIDPSGWTSVAEVLSNLSTWAGVQFFNAQTRAIAVLSARPIIAKALIYVQGSIAIANAIMDPGDAANDFATSGPAGFLDDVWDLFRNVKNQSQRIRNAVAFIGNFENGLPSGAVGRITKDMVNRVLGSSAGSHLGNTHIPGWDELGQLISNPNDRARGHLWAGWFGGMAHKKEFASNLVPLWASANNKMKSFESIVADGLKSGHYSAVVYRVTPRYSGNSKVPEYIDMEAFSELSDGSLLEIFRKLISNEQTSQATNLQ